MLLFFLSSTYGFSLLETRIQEARIHAPLYKFDPAKSNLLNEPAGFASSGWVPPGEYPQEDESSYWVNTKPHGNYSFERQRRFCLPQEKGSDFIETCYTHIMSTFWWGESIRLSNRYLCVGNGCHFTLVSTPITVEKNVSVLEKFVKIPLPPKPWRMYTRLTSQLKLKGDIYDDIEGIFWYKPIYWATSYHVRTTVFSTRNSTSTGDYHVLVYPASRSDHLEGLVGFHTGPFGKNLASLAGSFVEFYHVSD